MKTPKLFQSLFGKRNAASARFTVKGMNCGSCAERVENAVRQLPGISSVRVDLASGDVLVEHQPEKVTPEQIRQQIAAAGYATTIPAQ
jgi:copper chaperone CopZ